MSPPPDHSQGNVAGERSDAARNRARLLDAASGLIALRGAEHVTMQAVAEEAGVGKGTLFRRFGSRDGLLLALLEEVEADFHEAHTAGPPPLGPGIPAAERLVAFGCALIERAAVQADLGAALGRQVVYERRRGSDTGPAFHRHIENLLRETGIDADHAMTAHALLAVVGFGVADYLREVCEVPAARLEAAWADLVRRVTRPDEL